MFKVSGNFSIISVSLINVSSPADNDTYVADENMTVNWTVRGITPNNFSVQYWDDPDLNNVLETARGIDVPTPLTDEVMAMMQSLKDEGMGDADHSALVRYYEKLAGIELHR